MLLFRHTYFSWLLQSLLLAYVITKVCQSVEQVLKRAIPSLVQVVP